MSDNLTDRGPRDRTRVDVNETRELRYWSEKFGVSHENVTRVVAGRRRGTPSWRAGGRAQKVVMRRYVPKPRSAIADDRCLAHRCRDPAAHGVRSSTYAEHALALLAVVTAFGGGCAERDTDSHANSAYVSSARASGVRTEVYWDGKCKVERQWEPNGNYRDEPKCDDVPRTVSRADDGGPSVQRGVIVQPPPAIGQTQASGDK